jgi:hypothetical protein
MHDEASLSLPLRNQKDCRSVRSARLGAWAAGLWHPVARARNLIAAGKGIAMAETGTSYDPEIISFSIHFASGAGGQGARSIDV